MPVIPPAGVSPAGFFLGATGTDPGAPPGILADAIDPETGEYLSIVRSYDPTDAAVLTAIRTQAKSGSAVQNVGQKYHEATHVLPSLPDFLRQETEWALRHLTESGQISLETVDVVEGDDWAEVQIEYINVARQKRQKAVLPLTELLGTA